MQNWNVGYTGMNDFDTENLIKFFVLMKISLRICEYIYITSTYTYWMTVIDLQEICIFHEMGNYS